MTDHSAAAFHQRLKWHATAIGLFTVLAIAFTWPLAVYPNSSAPGDGYVFVNAFWWFKKALFSLGNPFFSDHIFYPDGASLVFQTTTFSNFIITLPVVIFAGVNQAINVAVIVGYILSGYFTFLLAYELTQDRLSSLIAGVIFAFNPFHYSVATTQLNVSTLQWLPLFLLCYKRTIEREHLKWPLFAGLVMCLIILTDQFQAILAVLMVLVALPFAILRCKNEDHGLRLDQASQMRKLVFFLAIFAVTTIVSSLGYTAQALQYLASHGNAFSIGIFEHGGANEMSADILGFVTPPTYNPFWGNSFPSIAPRWRNSHFIGYLPLLLAVWGGVACRRDAVVRFVIGISAISWVLSLGTTLHVNDVWVWGGDFFKLPFYYLAKLPIFSDIRTPYRFHILTLCGIGLLAAFGGRQLAITCFRSQKTKGIILTSIICALVLVEFMPSFTKPNITHVPKIYRQIAQDKEDYAVLELPLSRWSSFAKNGSGSPAIIMYYQTVHGKRIFNGLLARAATDELDFKNKLLNELADLTAYDNYVVVGQKKMTRVPADMDRAARDYGKQLAQDGADMLKKYNVRYIILHNPIADGTLSRAFIEGLTGRTVTFVPEDYISYIRLY